MRYLCVGDLHISLSNFEFISSLSDAVVESAARHKCDAVVLLGDILDRFGVPEMDCAVTFLKKVSEQIQTFVIVGNHDYTNNHQFLSDNHWMNSLKLARNITIVDRVVQVGRALFCPFIEEGRFSEALETAPINWRDSLVIFAHQGFAGAPSFRGPYQTRDSWSKSFPRVVSGHIHIHQYIEEMGVWYPGSVEEAKKNFFLLVDVEEDRVEMRALEVARQATRFFGTVSELLKELPPLNNAEITLKDQREVIEAFKKSSQFQNIGAHNSVKFIPQTLPFLDLFRRNILDTGDVFAFCAAERILCPDKEVIERDHLLIPLNHK